MGIDANIKLIAERLSELREIVGISIAEMAEITGVSNADYIEYEKGNKDFSFTFLYKASKHLRVDITDLLMGDAPKLSVYTVVRKDKGLPIERRQGFQYQNMAYLFKDRAVEPFVVVAPFSEDEQAKPIVLSTHEGHEFDIIIEGSLKTTVNGHVEILNEGDCIYYKSDYPHGMIATGGKSCKFLAVVIRR